MFGSPGVPPLAALPSNLILMYSSPYVRLHILCTELSAAPKNILLYGGLVALRLEPVVEEDPKVITQLLLIYKELYEVLLIVQLNGKLIRNELPSEDILVTVVQPDGGNGEAPVESPSSVDLLPSTTKSGIFGVALNVGVALGVGFGVGLGLGDGGGVGVGVAVGAQMSVPSPMELAQTGIGTLSFCVA